MDKVYTHAYTLVVCSAAWAGARGGGGGVYSFVACLSRWTIDHASRLRRQRAYSRYMSGVGVRVFFLSILRGSVLDLAVGRFRSGRSAGGAGGREIVLLLIVAFSIRFLAGTELAHTTKIAALGRCRRDVSVGMSLARRLHSPHCPEKRL